ncbi:MAG: SDR family NAD(P)-dependent oxidoreductase [Prevotellaceae bacterium]|jgi:NADP-dependent 3-hydroxy acid dehydrogenase YdfG|nr:SDR family NAD(P)-dependent oxidoreductase [Prevotellaceae bacterium]
MIAYITGATSGFGRACAKRLAKLGYDVILNGRRKELLASLGQEIEDKYGVHVWLANYDVRELDAVKQSVADLPASWQAIDVLINNAGLAVGLTNIQDGDFDDWNRMIDTNIKGLLYVTRLISPLMIARGKGHIINIGSVAGKDVYGGGNVYCATKHAVDALNKAMRIDMLAYGVKVSQIAPGAAETEFSIVRFKGNKEAADKVYEGYKPLTEEDIADAVEYLVKLPPHVCVNDLIITSLNQANASIIHKK